ncbi:MAG: hypothetical protein K6U04_01565 [Armatimonadetes bacterium]|nr:hypothetical protein [Armatimonadota bacterium]
MSIIRQPECNQEVKLVKSDFHSSEIIRDLLSLLDEQVERASEYPGSCYEQGLEVGIAIGYLLVIEKLTKNIGFVNVVHKFIETFVNISFEDLESLRKAIFCYLKARKDLLG